MKNNNKVVVIGLDGATFALIRPWVQAGHLPTFKKLLEESAFGNLKSTIPDITIPAWPSFATGCNPGKHGFYGFAKEKHNSYELTTEARPSWKIKQPTLWEILSSHGKKVGIINVPSTYPPKKVNGYMITGMLTPVSANFTYPPEFQAELKENIGEYNVLFSALSAKYPDTILQDMKKTLRDRMKAVEYLWRNKPLDFLMMVDNGTDRGGHMLWKFIDSSNPLYTAEDAKKYGNPLLDYYITIDGALGRIIDMIDRDTTLILMSDHGMGPNRKFVNLNMFLIEAGFMAIKHTPINRFVFHLFRKGFTPRNLHSLLTRLGVERYVGDKINEKNKISILNKLFFSASGIDWLKTRAFASGISNAITINLKGRQPQGAVAPGKDYENERNEIIRRLRNLKDPETGAHVVGSVFKREEVYSGKYFEKAPDIIAMPNDTYAFYGMHGFSTHKTITPTFSLSGFHRPYGIFLINGKGIKKGAEIRGAGITDLFPTILSIMNLPVPGHVDGKILSDVFDNKIMEGRGSHG